jgi:hypothetical protein
MNGRAPLQTIHRWGRLVFAEVFFSLFQKFKFQSYIILASCSVWITELTQVRNHLLTNITKITWLYIKWFSSCKFAGYVHVHLLAVSSSLSWHIPRNIRERRRDGRHITGVLVFTGINSISFTDSTVQNNHDESQCMYICTDSEMPCRWTYFTPFLRKSTDRVKLEQPLLPPPPRESAFQ